MRIIHTSEKFTDIRKSANDKYRLLRTKVTIPEVVQAAQLFHSLLEVVLVVLEFRRLSFLE